MISTPVYIISVITAIIISFFLGIVLASNTVSDLERENNVLRKNLCYNDDKENDSVKFTGDKRIIRGLNIKTDEKVQKQQKNKKRKG